jgi:hypothetical protein
MKQSAFTIIISFIMFSSFAQVTTDTAFIQRSNTKGAAQSIYFDNNRNSSAYSKISDFSFSTFDKQTYQSSLANLKENNLILSKQKSILPWTKWVLLKQYKGKFYAYKPVIFMRTIEFL